MKRTVEHSVHDRNLSERQILILKVAAEGYSNREIANALFLGLATVDSHFQTIKWKLGARSKVHAVAIAIRTGIV